MAVRVESTGIFPAGLGVVYRPNLGLLAKTKDMPEDESYAVYDGGPGGKCVTHIRFSF